MEREVEEYRQRLVISNLSEERCAELSRFATHELCALSYLSPEARRAESSRYSCSELFSALKEDGIITVLADRGPKLAGFLRALTDQQEAWIDWILVESGLRNRNIAWYLWRGMFSRLKARGITRMWGQILTANLEGLIMSRKIGFRFVQGGELWHGHSTVVVMREFS